MARKNKFAIGDTVRLKSGGPDMTVQLPPSGGANDSYRCQWFAGKKLEGGYFPAESLEKVEPESE